MLLPKQSTFTPANPVTSSSGSVISTVSFAIQPLKSVIIRVYVPATTLTRSSVVAPLDHK